MAFHPPMKKDRHAGNSSCVRQLARVYGVSIARLAELDGQEPNRFTEWIYDAGGISAHDAARLTSLLAQEKGRKHGAEHCFSGNQPYQSGML
ncbi:MAG: hypothetical protein MR842_04810 [Clostridiales bacterium]|nr:hypothetical protein [Clostridiales bacterium]MDY4007774.1 hypothetical protein [Candidatus Limiplasma sp.]